MNLTAVVVDRRQGEVRARVADAGLDGLLIRHVANIRYLTGFSGSNGWLWLSGERTVLCTDGRYRTQAEQEVPDAAGIELWVPREKILEHLLDRLSGLGAVRAAFEEVHVSHADWRRLCERAPAVEWVGAAGWVEASRCVKDEDERAAIREAAVIAGRALEETLPLVRAGMREREIASELDYRMGRLGSEGPAFETIVASGPRSALPHARSGDREIAEGDLLLIDFGARHAGYCCDLTRTFVLGAPGPRQREVYDGVAVARDAALAALRAGATGAEVDGGVRAAFEALGLDEHFTHSTGHGLGLEVHEGPRLYREGREPLPAGAVVTVEPGLYFPGWGGIRLEDDFLVTEAGCEALSTPASAGIPSIGS